jgi:hypothetical protein
LQSQAAAFAPCARTIGGAVELLNIIKATADFGQHNRRQPSGHNPANRSWLAL